MSTAIEFNHVGKQYRLGTVGTGTLSHDLNRWWQTSILGKEDPYLKIGDVNDRASAATSDYVWALRDIDFKVEQGDVVGIIGKNGAGKSTLLKLLSRVTGPTVGTINAKGRIASLLEVGTGFHQEMTGRENIYLNGAIMGMTRAEITRKLDEIVDFSGCERYLDTPVKRYSSGMTVRLGFAVAAFLEPEILVVDEVLAVGDAEFQKKAIGKMQDVSQGEGRTVLFVSHNMTAVENLCHNAIMLENGMLKMLGNVHDVVHYYLKDQKENRNFVREGTGELLFTDYYVENECINQGENLSIVLKFKTSRDINSSMLHVNVYNERGLHISQSITDDDKTFAMGFLSKGKEYIVRCVIRDINLRPGHYTLNIWAGSAYDWYDWLKECMSFTVVQNEDFISRQTVYPEDTECVFKSQWSYIK